MTWSPLTVEACPNEQMSEAAVTAHNASQQRQGTSAMEKCKRALAEGPVLSISLLQRVAFSISRTLFRSIVTSSAILPNKG